MPRSFIALIASKAFILASVFTVLAAALEFVLDGFSDLIRADLALIFGVAVLFIVDWVTGVAASLVRHEKITSEKLGKTILKGGQYGVFLFVAIIFENLFMATPFALVTDYSVVFSCFYLSVREGLSILENIGAGRFIGGMRALLRAARSGGDPDDVDAAINAISEDGPEPSARE